MRFDTFASPAALVATSLTARDVSSSSKNCTNMTIPITVSARNGNFSVTPLNDNLDTTAFFLNFTSIGGNFTAESLTGYIDQTGTYNISTQYCANTTSNSSTLLFLTHGIGFDKSYWDYPYNNFNYSFVDRALEAGYSTFSYDRLGNGDSSHPDPIEVVQEPTELAVLTELTNQIWNGSMQGVTTPQKIAHVGHSFGSILTMGLSVNTPNLTNAIVLTGFSSNSSFMGETVASWDTQLASVNQPDRFGDLPYGYLTWASNASNEYSFLYPSGFDPAILTYDEATKGPYTIGELFTMGGSATAANYTGPVMVVTGAEDKIFCGGDCYATGGTNGTILDVVSSSFPAASNFTTFLPNATGHGINLHYGAASAYTAILEYISGQGL